MLGARLVVVGADFHFGYKRHGDVALLQRMGAELGFEVLGLGLVASPESAAPDGGVPYSSTRARELLADGEVEPRRDDPRSARTRCAAWSSGATAAGASSASRPPTSRCPSGSACPPTASTSGTFEADDGVERPAAISLGRRPTFYEESGLLLLEAYVLDFDGDLYGQHASVRFLGRLRGQERFESVDALVEQMARDVEAVRRWLWP